MSLSTPCLVVRLKPDTTDTRTFMRRTVYIGVGQSLRSVQM